MRQAVLLELPGRRANEMPSQQKQICPEVLIVDDEMETCELLTEFCRSQNLPVASARDGRAAIEAIRRAPLHFGVVITDLHMPGADGFDVLRAAREANPGCYVVIITGYGTIDTAVRAVREGAYDYLTKPFALGQLDVVIRRIRDRMQLETENQEMSRELGGRAASTREIAKRLEAIETHLAHIDDFLRTSVSTGR